ncbi:hypothetical protein TVAG_213510 [Trichomonas vaginalis G3]|uniref:Uncharacterized protein n=1 Tax=Trichomonas vaginalis (strain ATCC PRA-98 / G3) TaxID=412133 RepID=A2EYT3_TRIV3|nr:hypothetical protein TVAGG3_0254270 [Trichomonas vaginalis G3]EAY02152.1 hypothetical protein TVAG_213510 [Trichomonas vaginalis G3]KAI5554249.1 hypothetical protein TVAGG3_0254270 [Trichomonas vaginalis G3]|eukprot:XP_001330555.1 hypothetical protein [Trichomonas vaginalis G3]
MSSKDVSTNSDRRPKPINSKQAMKIIKSGGSILEYQEKRNERFNGMNSSPKQTLYDRAMSWCMADLSNYTSHFMLIPIPFCLLSKQLVLRIPQKDNLHLWWKIKDTKAAGVSLYKYTNKIGIDSFPDIKYLRKESNIFKSYGCMKKKEKIQFRERYGKYGRDKYKSDYVRSKMNDNGVTSKEYKLTVKGLEEIENPIIIFMNALDGILNASDYRYKKVEDNVKYAVVFSLCLVFNSIVTENEFPNLDDFVRLLEIGTKSESWLDKEFISRLVVTFKIDTRPSIMGYKNLSDNMNYNGLLLPIYMLSLMTEPLKYLLSNICEKALNLPSNCDNWEEITYENLCKEIDYKILHEICIKFVQQLLDTPEIKEVCQNEFVKL